MTRHRFDRPDDALFDSDFNGALDSALLDSERDFNARPQRLEPYYRPLLVGMDKILTGLSWTGECWQAECQCLFRVQGLLVTGAPPGSVLTELSIGRRLLRGCPLGLDVFHLIEQLDSDPRHPARCRPHYPTAELGTLLRVKAAGPDGAPLAPPTTVTLWGISPSHV